MKSDWLKLRCKDIIDFNPRISLPKNTIAKKFAMENILPFTKFVSSYEITNYTGGAKFQNNDTIMARITPCLENGKTSYIDVLNKNEIAFGSTEFIVLRAKSQISDAQFIYYLAISPNFRKAAISSMTGSSGRQRVQQSILEEMEIEVPCIDEQQKIGMFLAYFDEKIRINNMINDNFLDNLNH